MIDLFTYKLIHLTGIFLIIMALGGVIMRTINGGDRHYGFRRVAALTHGIGMLLAITGGFGMLARLGIAHGGLPGWVIAKLCIWLLLGGFLALAQRKAGMAKPLWWATIVLAVCAAWLGLYKPAFADTAYGATASYHCEKKDGAKTVVIKDAKAWKTCKKAGGRWVKAGSSEPAAPAPQAPNPAPESPAAAGGGGW